jgi:hypothetical protein
MLRRDWPFDKTDSPGSSSLFDSKAGASDKDLRGGKDITNRDLDDSIRAGYG